MVHFYFEQFFDTKDTPTLTEQTPATESFPTKPKFVPVADTPVPNSEPPQGAGSDVAAPEQSLSRRQIIGRILALVLAMGITIVVFLFIDQEQIRRFQQYGYFGIFMTSLIGNASIALPIPSLFFTFIGGGTFNWIIVGLVSGIGEALGESTGYLAGFGGSAIIENHQTKLYDRMKHWMEKHGMLTIFVLSVVPNPIIDLAGIAAGASKYGYHKFLFSCWVGKTIKTSIFALAGAYSIDWLLGALQPWIG